MAPRLARAFFRLGDRAVALGWAEAQVLVIDEDLGQSGKSVAGRPSHTSTGVSNLHGAFSGKGSFTLLGFTSATIGTFQGNFDFVASDGDQLACNYGAGSPGTFTITPVTNGNVIVQFLAVFTPIPSQCTGRFADVIGGGFLQMVEGVSYITGWVDFAPVNENRDLPGEAVDNLVTVDGHMVSNSESLVSPRPVPSS